MYESFFGLNEKPFNLTPDPRYIYLSESHREALAALVYGVRERVGLITLTGPVGVGKTLILASFLDQIREHAETVTFTGSISRDRLEFLKDLCSALGIAPKQGSLFGVSQAIKDFALEKATAGRGLVVLVDEAQELGPAELEHFHHLCNLETPEAKLVQIVLAGTDALDETLKDEALEAVWQRVAIRCAIRPIEPGETIEYIFHRMSVAGGSADEAFSDEALWRIVNFAHGVPRLINLVCNHAMISAYSAGRSPVDGNAVREALKELREAQRGVGTPEIVGRHEIRGMVKRASRIRGEGPACSEGEENPVAGDAEDAPKEGEAGGEEGSTIRRERRPGLLSRLCPGRRSSLVLALVIPVALVGVVMTIGLLRARNDGGEPAEAGVLKQADVGRPGGSRVRTGPGAGMSPGKGGLPAGKDANRVRAGDPETRQGIVPAGVTKKAVRNRNVVEIALEYYSGLTGELLRELREKNPQVLDWNNLGEDVELVLPDLSRSMKGEADFYTIQVGAFRDGERASRRAADLTKKGAQNLFLVKGGVNNGYTFVCVGVFESGRECSGGITRMKEWGFPDAFPIRLQEKRLEDIVWRAARPRAPTRNVSRQDVSPPPKAS